MTEKKMEKEACSSKADSQISVLWDRSWEEFLVVEPHAFVVVENLEGIFAGPAVQSVGAASAEKAMSGILAALSSPLEFADLATSWVRQFVMDMVVAAAVVKIAAVPASMAVVTVPV